MKRTPRPADIAAKVANSVLPLGGTYSLNNVQAAAMTVAELLRHLNHATAGPSKVFEFPSEVEHVVQSLSTSALRLNQFAQLLARETGSFTGQDLYDSNGGDPDELIHTAMEDLIHTSKMAANLGVGLSSAARALARIGVRDNEEE